VSPQEFVDKWRAVTQTERATVQSHFNDLCDLLDEPKPHDSDPAGEWYAFEKGVTKTTGSEGWADVWKRHCFAWEYKGKHKDLDRAYAQLQQYAVALENPPLLVVSDIERIRVVTNWTNTVSVTREFTLEDLLNPNHRRTLKLVFSGSEELRTGESRAALTQKVARQFAELAQELEKAGHDPLKTAHFVNRLVFCMFAEDAGILPDKLFTKLLDGSRQKPESFEPLSRQLFGAMHQGGFFGADDVAWFNGGLFDDDATLPLTRPQIERVRNAAAQDWSAIDPSILGTLFERGLDPAKRGQLGAHYTDPENIMRVVEPVVLRPLLQEWKETKAKIEAAKQPAKKKAVLQDYLSRLRGVRVLDPACGSGNFLYMALRNLKDLEHRVLLEAEGLGLGRSYPELGPETVRGIELSPYAAELARVTVWIGELQWQIEHGFNVSRDPILKPLDNIENRDALMAESDGATVEAQWPEAEFIIGNPPFLGGKLLRTNLGDDYVNRMFAVYDERVPREGDLCLYWFEKARAHIEQGLTKRAGLLATQGIRGGANRRTLERIKETGDIFDAWSDLEWILEGAAVHVSIIGFDGGEETERSLDGQNVEQIHPNLTAEAPIHQARRLPQNLNIAFMGTTKGGPFEIDDDAARRLLERPNPHGKPNSDVIVPWVNGLAITRHDPRLWIIDFGVDMSLEDAALYEAPFARLENTVKPIRVKNRRDSYAKYWWRQVEPRPAMRRALAPLPRFLVTPAVAKHRLFTWLEAPTQPDHALFAFAVADDFSFGVLHSRFHEAWARAQGTQVRERESGFRYTPTTCFDTFPFPGADEQQRAAIAEAAQGLNELRENYLNPDHWTEDECLTFPATVGGPWHRWIPDADQLLPGTVAEARYIRRVPRRAVVKLVAERTLTKLYNENPTWLRHAHEKLDAAVAAAYGWDPHLPEAQIHVGLLLLNGSGTRTSS
jgi:type II restriction/modification system DNA methylase subunit YeeA